MVQQKLYCQQILQQNKNVWNSVEKITCTTKFDMRNMFLVSCIFVISHKNQMSVLTLQYNILQIKTFLFRFMTYEHYNYEFESYNFSKLSQKNFSDYQIIKVRKITCKVHIFIFFSLSQNIPLITTLDDSYYYMVDKKKITTIKNIFWGHHYNTIMISGVRFIYFYIIIYYHMEWSVCINKIK